MNAPSAWGGKCSIAPGYKKRRRIIPRGQAGKTSKLAIANRQLAISGRAGFGPFSSFCVAFFVVVLLAQQHLHACGERCLEGPVDLAQIIGHDGADRDREDKRIGAVGALDEVEQTALVLLAVV